MNSWEPNEDTLLRIRLAAEWWAEKVVRPDLKMTKRNGLDPNSERIESQLNRIASRFAPRVTPEQKERLIDNLYREMMDQLRGNKGRFAVRIDYHAPSWMDFAAQDAGIRGSFLFPVKTAMSITENGVMVEDGYGAPVTTLFGG